jgi:Integrase core domain.
MALHHSDLSPRELAVRFTDTESYFVSEASVYRLLKAHDLITSPAYIVIKANDEFKDKTMRPNEMWQTDVTYLKVIGWGWFYLSTILDDYSRYIIAWKLCTSMKVDDVTDTLDLALAATRSGSSTGRACCPTTARVTSPPISSNGWRNTRSTRSTALPAIRKRKGNRALAPDTEEPHPARKLILPRGPRSPDRRLRRAL